MRLADKAIIVTGGSKGFGRATALLFAREGGRVVVTGRGQEALDAVVAEAAEEGLELRAIAGDVSVEEDCRRTVEAVVAELGRIDVLFNNAGVINLRYSETEDGYETTFAVNHLAPFLFTNLLQERLRETPGARIVMTASAARKLPSSSQRNNPISKRDFENSKFVNCWGRLECMS